MNNRTTLFNKLIAPINKQYLERLVIQYNSDFRVQKFFTNEHLKLLIYYQLTGKESLKDIVDEISTNPVVEDLIVDISVSQISRKNESRNCCLFGDIFFHLLELMAKYKGLSTVYKEFGDVKVLDSTTISLCLAVFPWAEFRTTKGGIKIHTLYSLDTESTENAIVTNAHVHDSNLMDLMVTQPDCTYLYDRAYSNYKKLDAVHQNGSYFLTRLKKNAAMEVVKVNHVPDGSNVLTDAWVVLGQEVNGTKMRNPVRLIIVEDEKTGELIRLITNRIDLTCDQISDLYRLRWKIELFFRWLKGALKIERYFGHNLNAVLIQIFSALILQVLLALIKKESCFQGSITTLFRKIKYAALMTVKDTSFTWDDWLIANIK